MNAETYSYELVDSLVTHIQWGCPEEHELDELVEIGEMDEDEAERIRTAIKLCELWDGGRN